MHVRRRGGGGVRGPRCKNQYGGEWQKREKRVKKKHEGGAPFTEFHTETTSTSSEPNKTSSWIKQ